MKTQTASRRAAAQIQQSRKHHHARHAAKNPAVNDPSAPRTPAQQPEKSSPMRELLKALQTLVDLFESAQAAPASNDQTPGPDSFTPAPTTPAPSTSTTPSSSGCSAANPFLGNGPSHGPCGLYAKADASLTWDQLAKLLTEGKVAVNTSGSCGMTPSERLDGLRQYWDQSVKSGKSPAECGFSLMCGSNPPAGIHVA